MENRMENEMEIGGWTLLYLVIWGLPWGRSLGCSWRVIAEEKQKECLGFRV